MSLVKSKKFAAGRPVVLCIMDGVAYGPKYEADAVAQAYTPHLDALHTTSLHTKLKAHGTAVGMPSNDDMGNSEVGHNAIGCGRVFAQGAKLVKEAIETGSMFEGTTWKEQTNNVTQNNTTLHFIGLLSDGNVHSHIDHLVAMINQARKEGVKSIRLHTLLDGRDVGETSALDYIEPIEKLLAEHNQSGVDYRIASGGGRMFITMDRYDADWAMVERGWHTHVLGDGRQFSSAEEAIKTFRNETRCIDQNLPAFVIAENGNAIGPIVDGDSVIFCNFRGDRGIELCKTFEDENFNRFDRKRYPSVLYCGMMQYDGDLQIPKRYLVTPPAIDKTMGEYIANTGLRQLAVSETQKYGHVTYFFNGNRSGKFNDELEDYIEVPSDNVPFDERPWMKGAEITDIVIDSLRQKKHDFIRLNYPNADMIGHTGNFQAARMSVEAVDLCLARLIPEVKAAGGILVVTADHGNADEMYELDKQGVIKLDEAGIPRNKTCHTLNPVPCLIYDPLYDKNYTLADGKFGISSHSASCINLLGYDAPEDYDPSYII
ncbi:MAG: 2,3-bisphosphoglycerate-independent phosphoglycerate mutase [Lentisphaeria bacterium]|nr:2,3-bisphosphoglycerate-independent phosphoglycerate mutase [Lentisphaeria bacterium]NQZ67710.1 2,3-bisphosphoglycerate-independent phosphoglycerate mutase [Lentisphaeria bacterium]